MAEDQLGGVASAGGHAAPDAGPGTTGAAGWAPVDWRPVLRRRRLALLGLAGGAVLLCAGFFAVLSVLAGAWPTRYACVLVALVALGALGAAWPVLSAERRGRWEERQRTEVLVQHALREHDGVGVDLRDTVTERAAAQRSLADVALFGYPLLVVLVAFLLGHDRSLPGLAVLLGTLAAAALCAGALVASRRRGARARRWLEQPLPPEA